MNGWARTQQTHFNLIHFPRETMHDYMFSVCLNMYLQVFNIRYKKYQQQKGRKQALQL